MSAMFRACFFFTLYARTDTLGEYSPQFGTRRPANQYREREAG